MNNLISIVIPIFNVEKFLEKCIDSILAQEYQEYELILVNDGSTDNSRQICDSYIAKDSRLEVIHKKNEGVSSARNEGIEKAKGEYIVFIDPDDQIASNYLEKLVSVAEEYNCDAVISGFKTIPDNNISKPGFKLNNIMSGRDLVLSSSNIHSNNDLCFVWRYIYKLQTIKEKKVKFHEEVHTGEDVVFNLEFLLIADRVYAIPDPLYFYTVNNFQSTMKKLYKSHLEKSLIVQHQIRKTLSLKFNLYDYDYYKKDFAYYYINTIYNLMVKNLINNKDGNLDEGIRRILRYDMFSDSMKEIGFFYKCDNFKEYLFYFALKLKLYPLIVEFYKKEKELYLTKIQ